MDRRIVVRVSRWTVALMAGASLAACASLTTPKYAIRDGAASPQAKSAGAGRTYKTGEPYQVGGIWYVPHEQPNYDETGTASWYGDAFQMKATANGEIFDMNAFSAAHTTLPLPSLVEVTNLDNGKRLVVRVNDRGPFVGGRIIDLSHAAARELGYDRSGLARVRVRYVGPAALAGPEAGMRVAQATPQAPVKAADDDVQLTSFKPAAPVEVATLTALPAAKPAPGRGIHIELAGAPSQSYRIQAGAFSDQENARRAAAQLAGAGVATIEPIERNGTTLYRVVLPGPADEAEAYAFRDKVAASGFTDARVLRPPVQ